MIQLKKEIFEKINAHGERDFPNECCGFLFGKETEHRVINQILPAGNFKEGDKRRRFEIRPKDYLAAELYAAQNDLELLGIYHSHPNHPAIASEHDLQQALPFFSYVIVSIREAKAAEIKSWRLEEDEMVFLEEEIKIH